MIGLNLNMTKFPLLEQMRMQRDQRESPELKELRAQNAAAWFQVNSRQRIIDQMSKFMSDEVSKPMLNRIGHELAVSLVQEIFKAIPAGEFSRTTLEYYFKLPQEALNRLSNEELIHRIADQYRLASYKPGVRFIDYMDYSEEPPVVKGTAIDIKIPSLGYREVVWKD